MTCMARIFGAPVTDPHGNRARTTSPSAAPGRSVAWTVDVICVTVA